MRLEELVPERLIWVLGTLALLLAGSLFLYELLHPGVAVMAKGNASAWVEKSSPFLAPAEAIPNVLVRLPALDTKYQRKVLYLVQPRWRQTLLDKPYLVKSSWKQAR
ncbi:MAG: hypothetical protein OHK0021_13950 [Bryobacter sp.]